VDSWKKIPLWHLRRGPYSFAGGEGQKMSKKIYLTKKDHVVIEESLKDRFQNLVYLMEPLELENGFDGAGGRGRTWSFPKNMCKTRGTVLEIKMAVDDFKTILAQVKGLK
jgi:hypothetical protein